MFDIPWQTGTIRDVHVKKERKNVTWAHSPLLLLLLLLQFLLCLLLLLPLGRLLCQTVPQLRFTMFLSGIRAELSPLLLPLWLLLPSLLLLRSLPVSLSLLCERCEHENTAEGRESEPLKT